MFANVNVIAGRDQKVVTLPRTAITYSLYGESVFVVTPDAHDPTAAQAAPGGADRVMKIERKPVRTGATVEDRIAITEGVDPGTIVVSEGQLKLQSGARVRIDPSARLEPASARPKE
jgi:membrane fusion protein, multidrug efflux system